VARYHILYIQNGADLVRHHFAIRVRNALGLIDRNTHKLILSAAFDFDFHDFDAFGPGHALRDLLDSR
jgi:hypothetical protein